MPDEFCRTPTSTPVSIHLYPSRESPEGDLGVGAARFDNPITLKTPEPENVLHLFREEDKCLRHGGRHWGRRDIRLWQGRGIPGLGNTCLTYRQMPTPNISKPFFPPNGDSQHLEAGHNPPGAEDSRTQRVQFSLFQKNGGVDIRRTPAALICGGISQTIAPINSSLPRFPSGGIHSALPLKPESRRI